MDRPWRGLARLRSDRRSGAGDPVDSDEPRAPDARDENAKDADRPATKEESEAATDDLLQLRSFLRQSQAVGAALLAIVGLMFSDVTGVIAADAGSQLRVALATLATLVLLTGACDATAWVYAHAHAREGDQVPENLTEGQAGSLRMVRRFVSLCGRAAVAGVVAAGVLYLLIAWCWAAS